MGANTSRRIKEIKQNLKYIYCRWFGMDLTSVSKKQKQNLDVFLGVLAVIWVWNKELDSIRRSKLLSQFSRNYKTVPAFHSWETIGIFTCVIFQKLLLSFLHQFLHRSHQVLNTPCVSWNTDLYPWCSTRIFIVLSTYPANILHQLSQCEWFSDQFYSSNLLYQFSLYISSDFQEACTAQRMGSHQRCCINKGKNKKRCTWRNTKYTIGQCLKKDLIHLESILRWFQQKHTHINILWGFASTFLHIQNWEN